MNDKLKESEKVKEPDEFFHVVGGDTAAIDLRIPINQIKDIDSVIKKAKEAGFDAEELEKLKNVAIEVSKEDYSYHIENLNFPISRGNNSDSSNTDMAQNDSHTTVKELEKLCKVLGIPVVSKAEELKKLNPNSTVIFASKHDNSDTEPYMIKEILNQKLNNGKKTILGFEFYSDEYFVNLLNDPKRNLNDDTFNELLSLMPFEKTVSGLVEAFNEIQQKYPRDRFEIKLFDVTYAEETLERLEDAIMGDREKEKEYDEKRDAQIVKNILDLLKTYGDDNLVFYTGRFHVIDMLTKLKEITESGNKEGIKINNIIVFLTPRDQSLSDYEQRKLELLNDFIGNIRK